MASTTSTTSAPDYVEWLSTSDIARLYGLSDFAIRRAVRLGHLEALRLGPRGNYRFRRDVIERLIDSAERPLPADPGAATDGGQSTRAAGAAADLFGTAAAPSNDQGGNE